MARIEVGSGLGITVAIDYDERNGPLGERLRELQRLGVPTLCDCGSVNFAAQAHLLTTDRDVFGTAVISAITMTCTRCGQFRLYTMRAR